MTLVSSQKLKILDFDIENRPLSYWLPDQPTSEITVIASCWVGDLGSMEVLALGEFDKVTMLLNFLQRYNEADIVTGHYIRRHDLPTINGELLEYGFRPLQPKLTIDTKLDMVKKRGIPATQEYLSELLDIPVEKKHMSQVEWRHANRLYDEGIRLAKERGSRDVLQHMLLREAMLKRKMLNPPRMWSP